MFTKAVDLPARFAVADLPAALEAAVASSGLMVASRGTLKSCPGCVHWHIKHSTASGTLELTWWPQANQCWFKIAHNRHSGWMDDAMSSIARALSTGARAAHARQPARHPPE